MGLLSRNIRIEAELQKHCYSHSAHEKYLCSLFHRDTFGGHVMVNFYLSYFFIYCDKVSFGHLNFLLHK